MESAAGGTALRRTGGGVPSTRGDGIEQTVLADRAQGRPDAGALPAFVRRVERRRAAPRPNRAVRLPGTHEFLSVRDRIGAVRVFRQGLSRPDGARNRA